MSQPVGTIGKTLLLVGTTANRPRRRSGCGPRTGFSRFGKGLGQLDAVGTGVQGWVKNCDFSAKNFYSSQYAKAHGYPPSDS